MSRIRELITEIHRRSIWQVLAVYVLGAAASYQVIQSLTEGLGLPYWFPAFAVVLFIVLLPVVLALAIVREEPPPDAPTTLPVEDPEIGAADRRRPVSSGRARQGKHILTWQRALLGLLGIFALWGLFAAGWLLFGGVGRAPRDTVLASLGTKLVVLPFENLGPTEDEYFAEGITEEITSRLAEIPGLGVISRTSALTYKDSSKPTPTIGEELDVDYILEGTVRWERIPDAPSRVRVTPQLIRVSDDTNIWTERYDAVLSQIFSVQSDIAEKVALALDIALLEPQRQTLAVKPTENLEAYDYYLKGLDYFGRRFNEDDARTSAQLFERAVALDPSFVPAWAALSRARVWLHFQFGRSSELPRAHSAVEEALKLAPESPEAHMALGDYHYYGRLDYQSALEHYLTVQRRQPANAEAIALIAWIQRRQANFERSIANAERALELDPRNTVTVIGQAQNYFYTRRWAEGELYFQKAIALAPDVAYYYRWAIWFYLAWDGDRQRAGQLVDLAAERIELGELLVGGEASWVILDVFGDELAGALERLRLERAGIDTAYYHLARAQVAARRDKLEVAHSYYDSARAVLEARVEAAPGRFAPHHALGVAYAGLGRTADAIREGERGVELLPVAIDAMSGVDRLKDLARIYVMVGRYEAAIEPLALLLKSPSHISANLLAVDPFWAPLRTYPAFTKLLERHR